MLEYFYSAILLDADNNRLGVSDGVLKKSTPITLDEAKEDLLGSCPNDVAYVVFTAFNEIPYTGVRSDRC